MLDGYFEYEHKASVTEVYVADHRATGMEMNISDWAADPTTIQSQISPIMSLISVPETEKVLVPQLF